MKAYLKISAALLAATATAKLISAFGHEGILNVYDPVLHLSTRTVMIGVAAVEYCVVGLIVLSKRELLSFAACAFLGLEFLLYRVALGLIGEHNCPCLGFVGDWLKISPVGIAVFLWLTAIYLCLGGLMGDWKLLCGTSSQSDGASGILSAADTANEAPSEARN